MQISPLALQKLLFCCVSFYKGDILKLNIRYALFTLPPPSVNVKIPGGEKNLPGFCCDYVYYRIDTRKSSVADIFSS